MLRTSALLLFSSFLILCTTQAQVVIDFNSIDPGPGDGYIEYGASYTEEGFTLTSLGFNSPQTGNFAYLGSTSLVIGGSGDTATLTQDGGGAFDLESIVLAPWTGGGQTVTFTGTKSGGGTVLQEFTVPTGTPPSAVQQTFTFSSDFTNLVSVNFSQNASPTSYYQFDDITVTPVPEPATLALFALGSGVVLYGFRRRRIS